MPYIFSDETLPANAIDQKSRIKSPRCHPCEGPIRPDVAWCGLVKNCLPAKVWHMAKEACQHCDLMLVIGTSGIVWPVAHLPYLTDQEGLKCWCRLKFDYL